MAESSLVYPKSESRNSNLRSPEETQRVISLLLAKVAIAEERADRLEERVEALERRG